MKSPIEQAIHVTIDAWWDKGPDTKEALEAAIKDAMIGLLESRDLQICNGCGQPIVFYV